MKLLFRITISLLAALVPIMALWAVLFYYAVAREINDEADESLEDYAELIIRRCREGRELPALNSGSNNSYTIEPVEQWEAMELRGAVYSDREVYIPERGETEPARVLTKIFNNGKGQYLRLEVAMPTFEKDDLRETILYWVVTLFALLLFVVVLISLLVFRHALRPLYALLRWLDGYTPGRGIVEVPNDTDVSEFRRLNAAAQSAITRSEMLLERQNQFIGNASHELQTPLAVIGNRVEYLIDHTSPSEEQLAELAKIQHSLRHSVRLNRTLLLLMRIESGQVAESSEEDVVEVVRDVVESLGEIYAERGIRCSMSLAPHLYIYINESLLRVLVSNVIKNAFTHTPEGGDVDVSVGDKVLCVTNSGDTPLDGSRLFERFYTATSRAGSTGLGLPIVRSICEHYNFRVTYSYDERSCRHIFTIRF